MHVTARRKPRSTLAGQPCGLLKTVTFALGTDSSLFSLPYFRFHFRTSVSALHFSVSTCLVITPLSVVSSSLSFLSCIMQVSPGSQVLLDNAERYGIYFARSLSDTNSAQVLSRKNIGIIICIIEKYPLYRLFTQKV